MKLKVEEMQCMTLSIVFMAQEEKYKGKIEKLTKTLQAHEQEERQVGEAQPDAVPLQILLPIS